MGHIRGQQWGMHKGSNGPYMGAAMGHITKHTMEHTMAQ